MEGEMEGEVTVEEVEEIVDEEEEVERQEEEVEEEVILVVEGEEIQTKVAVVVVQTKIAQWLKCLGFKEHSLAQE